MSEIDEVLKRFEAFKNGGERFNTSRSGEVDNLAQEIANAIIAGKVTTTSDLLGKIRESGIVPAETIDAIEDVAKQE